MAHAAVGQLVKLAIDYHFSISNSTLFHDLAQWSTGSASSVLQESVQINKNESLSNNLYHGVSIAGYALLARVGGIGILFLEAADVFTAKAIVRPFRTIKIMYDDGLNIESMKRAGTAAALSGAITICKIAVAAGAIISPELTLGYLQLEKQLAKMQFWWVALRLSSIDLEWFKTRYPEETPVSTLRSH